QFPADSWNDGGTQYLVLAEGPGRGYEVATRNLLERSLQAQDLFLDVGSHFGLFALQAVTHSAGGIQSIAFEPDPLNASIIYRNTWSNEQLGNIHLVSAACADSAGIAPLVSSTTMSHSLYAAGLVGQRHGPTKWVGTVAIDSVLPCFPHLQNRRIV